MSRNIGDDIQFDDEEILKNAFNSTSSIGVKRLYDHKPLINDVKPEVVPVKKHCATKNATASNSGSTRNSTTSHAVLEADVFHNCRGKGVLKPNMEIDNKIDPSKKNNSQHAVFTGHGAVHGISHGLPQKLSTDDIRTNISGCDSKLMKEDFDFQFDDEDFDWVSIIPEQVSQNSCSETRELGDDSFGKSTKHIPRASCKEIDFENHKNGMKSTVACRSPTSDIQCFPSTSFSTVLDTRCSTSETEKLKLPGPIGLLPQLCAGDSVKSINLDALSEIIRQGSVQPKQVLEPQVTALSEVSKNLFVKGPWITMKCDLSCGNPGNPRQILDKYNIAQVLDRAKKKQLLRGKVSFLAVLVQSLSFTGADASATFADQTGEMQGAIHRKLVEDYRDILQVGSALILKQPSVLSISPQRHYLNIMINNIVQIYAVNENGSTSCTKLSDICLKSLVNDAIEASNAPCISPIPQTNLCQSPLTPSFAKEFVSSDLSPASALKYTLSSSKNQIEKGCNKTPSYRCNNSSIASTGNSKNDVYRKQNQLMPIPGVVAPSINQPHSSSSCSRFVDKEKCIVVESRSPKFMTNLPKISTTSPKSLDANCIKVGKFTFWKDSGTEGTIKAGVSKPSEKSVSVPNIHVGCTVDSIATNDSKTSHIVPVSEDQFWGEDIDNYLLQELDGIVP